MSAFMEIKLKEHHERAIEGELPLYIGYFGGLGYGISPPPCEYLKCGKIYRSQIMSANFRQARS